MNAVDASVKKTGGRMAFWDNIKFLMIILMVIGHFADEQVRNSDICKSIYLFLYAFHMPVMIFISGMFYKREHTFRKIAFYLTCWISLRGALYLVERLTGKDTEFILLTDQGIAWFFFALAAFLFILFLCVKVNKIFLLIASLVLACFAGYDQSIGDFLYLSRIIIFFPVFLLGTLFKPEQVQDFMMQKKRIIIPVGIILLLIWFSLCFFKLDSFYIYRHLFTGRNPFSKDVISYGPLARFMCYVITFLTGFIVISLIPKKRIRIVSEFGKYTINVYFWHWIIFMILDKIFLIKDLYTQSAFGRIVFFILPVLIGILIMWIKLFDQPVKLIRKITDKIRF